MQMNKNLRTVIAIGLASGSLLLVGCNDPNALIDPKLASRGKESKEYIPGAQAGVAKDIAKTMDPGRLKPYIMNTSRFGRRSNPFALSSEEKAYDAAQASERLQIEGGAFNSLFEPPVDTSGVVKPVEAQPYRRLSGILVGDSVLAILEEDGKSIIVRPGMLIPNTNWRVISIDRDRAILRREGSDLLPREVEVRLEIGFPTGGNGGGGNGPVGGRPGAGGGPGDAPGVGGAASPGGGPGQAGAG